MAPALPEFLPAGWGHGLFSPLPRRTSFAQALPQEAQTMEELLQEIEDFNQSFTVLRGGGKGLPPVPESSATQWDKIYDAKDRLGKVRDYIMSCQNMEETLIGPRPEWGVADNASQLMENSVSARINSVVRSSSELSAACDKASSLIGSPTEQGVGAEVDSISKKLRDAQDTLHEIVVGQAEPKEATQASMQEMLLLLPPTTVHSHRSRPGYCWAASAGNAFL
eukprot:TRINITY_DN107646_c0_g1_i1.p1 TRINITY_DN107646_c0_g1~~TRINITY_DN107646_c0_g1_i1.p1  ORF type:complete len:236 (+),score=53.67 TRINITY_DN107646_c0_g1_i1:42-710(+)